MCSVRCTWPSAASKSATRSASQRRGATAAPTRGANHVKVGGLVGDAPVKLHRRHCGGVSARRPSAAERSPLAVACVRPHARDLHLVLERDDKLLRVACRGQSAPGRRTGQRATPRTPCRAPECLHRAATGRVNWMPGAPWAKGALTHPRSPLGGATCGAAPHQRAVPEAGQMRELADPRSKQTRLAHPRGRPAPPAQGWTWWRSPAPAVPDRIAGRGVWEEGGDLPEISAVCRRSRGRGAGRGSGWTRPHCSASMRMESSPPNGWDPGAPRCPPQHSSAFRHRTPAAHSRSGAGANGSGAGLRRAWQDFNERTGLTAVWFSGLDAERRQRFMAMMLEQLEPPERDHARGLLVQQCGAGGGGYSPALGQRIMLKIFSWLDPRSLSRCAVVCHHWRHIAIMDVLWRPKCCRRSWFLPYTPVRPIRLGAAGSARAQCVGAGCVRAGGVEGALHPVRAGVAASTPPTARAALCDPRSERH